jgi:hypothetical protein
MLTFVSGVFSRLSPSRAGLFSFWLSLPVLASLLIACSASPVTEKTRASSDAELLAALADGTAQLTRLSASTGYAEAMAEAKAAAHFRGLYDTRNWDALAVAVMRAGCGSDLSWFYLGRAAEETGHLASARIYFQNSIVAAQQKGVSGCIACAGFDFPEDSEARLRAVDQQIDEADKR